MDKYFVPGIPDSEFIRDKIPMTKEEVRSVVLSKLDLLPHHIALDIGAGTGSISVELSKILKDGIVYSIEKNESACDLIKENFKKFECDNATLLEEEATKALENITKVDRIVVGGSGGKLREILNWSDENLLTGGVIVITAITLETLNNSITILEEIGFTNIDASQITVSKIKKVANYHMMEGCNPVFIIKGVKK